MKCPACGAQTTDSVTRCAVCGLALSTERPVHASTADRVAERFVGRAEELTMLRAGLDDAFAGRGRVVFLVGEPGIGKTRLAGELASEARRQGARVLIGRAHEGDGAPPFWPWVQVVRGYLDGIENDTLRIDLGSGAADVARVIPDLRERLPDIPSPVALPWEQARFSLFDSLTRCFKAAARRQPLVLILEDLHWFDIPSLLLFRFMTRASPDARLLLIGTYRDIGLDRHHPLVQIGGEVMGQPDSQTLTLEGLSGHEVASFIESATGQAPPPRLVTSITRETEGNPLFLTEVVRMLVAERRLSASESWDRPSFAVPHGVRAAIGRRLQGLSTPCQEGLALAAVLGREWSATALEALLELQSPHAPAGQALQEVLEEAVAARIIAVVANAVRRYSFTHALIRETLYEELNAARRSQLHRQIVEVLESVFRPSETPPSAPTSGRALAELAYHAFRAIEGGGPIDRAIAYSTRAGDSAMGALAYEDAVLHYQRALEALELGPRDEPGQTELLLRLGRARGKAGEVAQAREAFERAAALARGLTHGGDPRGTNLFARAVLGQGGEWWVGTGRPDVALVREAIEALGSRDSELRAQLLSRLAVTLYHFPDAQASRTAVSHEAVEMARRIGDPATLALALHSRHWALWDPPHLEARLAVATELARSASEIGARELVLQALAWRVGAQLELADIDAVRREIETYARLAEELRQPLYQWWTPMFRAMLAMLRGAFAQGERLAREGAALGERVQSDVAQQIFAGHLGFLREIQGPIAELEAPIKALADRHPAAPIWRANLAHIYAQLGRIGEARREFETVAGRDFSDVPQDLRWLPIMTLLAQAAAALGDRRRASILYDLLRPYAGRIVAVASGAGPCMGAVSRSLGLLATALSRWPAAEQHFQDALAASARIGAHPWVAVVQRDYARMLLTRAEPGDRDQRRQLLAAARASARELGMARLQQSVESADLEASASAVPADDRESERPPTPPRAKGDVPRTAGRPPAAVRSGNAFQLDGEFWTLEYQHVVHRLKDARGLRYLAALVHAPEREFHVLDLAALTARPAAPSGRVGLQRNRGQLPEDFHLSDRGDAGPPLDARARDAYRQRVKDLEGDLEEAERFHDPERAARAQAETEFILGQLAGAYGLHGRPRRLGAADEQARKNVTNCIRHSLRRIEQAHPALGRHLRRSIKTGVLCSYRPEQPTSWDL